MAPFAELSPRHAHKKARACRRRKLAGLKGAKTGRTLEGESQREIPKPGVVSDEKDILVVLAEPRKAAEKLLAVGEIKLVLDHKPRPLAERREDEFHRLARPARRRAKDEVERSDLRRKSVAHAPRRFGPAPGERPLEILDVLLPARFGMA